MCAMEHQICTTPNKTPSPLATHKNSQTISKTKPKIRIIHIFAPEIIKTDAANFRELVQRLTGKPTEEDTKKVLKTSVKQEPFPVKKERYFCPKMKMEMEMAMRYHAERMTMNNDGEVEEEEEEEEEIWRSANSGGGFLGGFGDHHHHQYFDGGFMQELNNYDHQYFPFLEGTTTTHMVDVYGPSDSQLLA